ncbi:MAG: hypothetical protein ACMUIS_11090 [bacterium]
MEKIRIMALVAGRARSLGGGEQDGAGENILKKDADLQRKMNLYAVLCKKG